MTTPRGPFMEVIDWATIKLSWMEKRNGIEMDLAYCATALQAGGSVTGLPIIPYRLTTTGDTASHATGALSSFTLRRQVIEREPSCVLPCLAFLP